jgi:Domain of unknown function (DUF4142)
MKRITLAVALLTLALPAMAVGRDRHPPRRRRKPRTLFTRRRAPTRSKSSRARSRCGKPRTNSQGFRKLDDQGPHKNRRRVQVNRAEAKPSAAEGTRQQVPVLAQAAAIRIRNTIRSRTYALMMLSGHRQAVKLFHSYAQNGDDQQLKQWAQQTLPGASAPRRGNGAQSSYPSFGALAVSATTLLRIVISLELFA